jgi:hypothetical protein
MHPSIALRITGSVLLILGVVLVAAPADVAVLLGTSGPAPANGASDPQAMEFWRQLTFIRMFSAAAIGVGAVCLWARSRLTRPQQASLLKVLVGVFAWMFLIALSQQTAIWGAAAGWVLVGVIGVVALACLAAVIENFRNRRDSVVNA